VFSDVSLNRVILRLPLGASLQPPVELYTDGNPDSWRASTSADGVTIVFERMAGSRHEVWVKNMATGEQRFVMPVQANRLVNATVSGDGARLVFDLENEDAFDTGEGYVADIAGGVPQLVCHKCGLYGFASDSRRPIGVTERKTIRIFDRRGDVDLITLSDGNVVRPALSPDERWIGFRVEKGARAKSYVAPVTPGRVTDASRWIEIDEPTTTGRPCGWSADSSMMYLLLDVDGHRDLWGQKMGANGPIGKPVAIRHLHDVAGVSTSLGNAITPQGFMFESARRRGNVWMLSSNEPR